MSRAFDISSFDGFRPDAIDMTRNLAVLPGSGVWDARTAHNPMLFVSLKGCLSIETVDGLVTAPASYAIYVPPAAAFACATGNDNTTVFALSLNCADAYTFSETPDQPRRLEDSLSYYLIAACVSRTLRSRDECDWRRLIDGANLFAAGRRHQEMIWSNPVIDALSGCLHSALSLAALGEMMSMHPMALAKKFRKYHGCSIGMFRQRMRAERAFYRVIKQTTPLSDISLACGYADQSHMTRAFQRFFALTPAYLRKSSQPVCQ